MSLQRVLSPSSKQRLEITGNGHPKGVATVMSLLQRDPILESVRVERVQEECKEPDPVHLIQHILSIKGDVTWSRCRNKGNREVRAMKSADFAAAVKALVDPGQGTVVEGKSSLGFLANRNDTG